MNSSNENLTESRDYMIYKVTKEINLYVCLVSVLVGLVGNLLTIYLLKSTPNTKNTSTIPGSSYNNRQVCRSLSSSQWYMLALATSDSLFLIAHLFEDILPSVSTLHVFHIINQSNLICKFVLFMRNGARVNSSYLVVFFAWERYVVISRPLKRLRFHNKKITRSIIIGVFTVTFLLTSYTLFISGLRNKEGHESETEDLNNKVTNLECDTKNEFKKIYDYIIFSYVSLGIILPIILVCYFNIFIVHVLLTRKNEIYRKSFPSLKPSYSSFGLNADSKTNIENNHLLPNNSEVSITNKANYNRLIKSYQNDTNDCVVEKPKLFKSLSMNSIDSIGVKSRNLLNRNKINSLTCCYESQAANDSRRPSASAQIFNFRKHVTTNLYDKSIPRISINQELLSIQPSGNGNAGNRGSASSSGCGGSKRVSFISTEFNANPKSNNNFQSYASCIKDESVSYLTQYSGVAKKLRESGRATLILILISLFFVALNLPYILAWLSFFIPFKNSKLSSLDIYYRYSFVSITEIFHILNFCINILLYCMASKQFRKELKLRFGFNKTIKIKLTLNPEFNKIQSRKRVVNKPIVNI